MKGLLVLLALAIAFVGCARGSRTVSEAAASAAAQNPASASDGATLYLANCSSCHQANGEGVPGAFPPLAGNPIVTGNSAAVIEIVKIGLQGRVEVNGAAYSGIMPRWKNLLSDDQIAAVISYVRGAWKNNAPAVSISDVRAIK
jgi:mono/diheme cytochrome c family protein